MQIGQRQKEIANHGESDVKEYRHSGHNEQVTIWNESEDVSKALKANSREDEKCR